MSEADLSLYFKVLHALEALNIPYVIIGAFAGVSYGVNRATYDLDMVVDMNESQIEALAAAFPPPRYYADPHQMRDSIRLGILFNIIDTSAGQKVDLIPLSMAPGYGFALQNRIRREVPTDTGQTENVWLARPEDVIVGKLMAWNEGRSYKHESDIRDILEALKLGLEPELAESFDVQYVDRWALRISEDAATFWEQLKQVTDFK